MVTKRWANRPSVEVCICTEATVHSLDSAKAQYYWTRCTSGKSFAKLQEWARKEIYSEREGTRF